MRPRLTTSTTALAACAGLAPTARRPVSTTANELVNPTTAHTTPAPMGTDRLTAWPVSCEIASRWGTAHLLPFCSRNVLFAER